MRNEPTSDELRRRRYRAWRKFKLNTAPLKRAIADGKARIVETETEIAKLMTQAESSQPEKLQFLRQSELTLASLKREIAQHEAQAERLEAQLDEDVLSQFDAENSFMREGSVWLIGHGEEYCHLPHQVGFEYIAKLLTRPGVPIKATELMAGAPGQVGSAGGPMEEDISVSNESLPQELSDKKAICEYKKRALTLGAEIEDAKERGSRETAEELTTELEAIEQQIRSDRGLRGRGRNFPNPNERARTSTTQAILRAIKVIEKSCPRTAEHLRKHIETGFFLAYRDTTTNWKVS